MRIISDFKDYYDGILMANYDAQDRLYVRKYQEIPRQAGLYQAPKEIRFYDGCWYVLLFAGHAYPGAQISYPWIPKFGPGKLIFNIESLDKYVKEFKGKSSLVSTYDKPMHGHTKETYRDSIVEKFKMASPVKIDPSVFHRFDSPIIVYRMFQAYKDGSPLNTVYLNPSLKELGFSSVMLAEQAAQELEMFFHSEFLEHPKPMVQVSDLNRLEAHGFDKKTSFRKSKQEKKT